MTVVLANNGFHASLFSVPILGPTIYTLLIKSANSAFRAGRVFIM
jgi:hypothetical protein